MSDFWNLKVLKPPPVYTIHCNSDKTNAGELHAVCMELHATLKNHKVFHTEAAILSRIIYKTKNKFKGDKGFQNIRKVKQCLLRYLGLQRLQVLENFIQCLPERFAGTMAYLPSCQMLQYVLVRLLGLAKLLQQTSSFCESAALGKGQRVQLGHSWPLATVMLGITARIWTLCRRWVWVICQSYKSLLTFLPQLPSSDAPWLPDTFSFPTDLAIWLGAHRPLTTDKDSKITSQKIPYSSKIFELLIDDDEVEEAVLNVEVETFVLNDPFHVSKSKPDDQKRISVPSTINIEDLGESVRQRSQVMKTSPLRNEIDALQTCDDVTKFMSKTLKGEGQKYVKVTQKLENVIKKLRKVSKSGNNRQVADLMNSIKFIFRQNLL